MTTIPEGYCQCGCGQRTNIAPWSNATQGYIIGTPRRYIHGHHQRGRIVKPVSERFWAKVDKRGPDDCWLWKGQKDTDGYGRLKIKGKRVIASRLTWELTKGPIPDGLLALHTCDNPPCCNPVHIFLGTHKDNSDDRVRKGRGSHKATTVKYSPEQISELRRRVAAGEGQTAVARDLGISPKYGWSIARNRVWKNIP